MDCSHFNILLERSRAGNRKKSLLWGTHSLQTTTTHLVPLCSSEGWSYNIQQSKLGNSLRPSPAFTEVHNQRVFCSTHVMGPGISHGNVGLQRKGGTSVGDRHLTKWHLTFIELIVTFLSSHYIEGPYDAWTEREVKNSSLTLQSWQKNPN